MKFYRILSLLLLATVSTLQATFPLSINSTLFQEVLEAPFFDVDVYSSVERVYALEYVSTTYQTGGGDIVRVRRGGDNVESNFTPDELRDGTADTWSTAGSGDGNFYITTWNDQSGNAANLVQATASSQPKLRDSTTGITEDGDGNISINFTGSTGTGGQSVLTGSDWSATTTDATIVAVADNAGGNDYLAAFDGNLHAYYVAGNANGVMRHGGTFYTPFVTDGTTQMFSWVMGATTFDHRLDGTVTVHDDVSYSKRVYTATKCR